MSSKTDVSSNTSDEAGGANVEQASSSGEDTTREKMDTKEERVTGLDVETAIPPSRVKLIESAVKFLLNHQVRNSPLSQKKAFLLKKGLTAEEIEIAVNRSGTKADIPNSPVTQPLLHTSAVPPNQPPGDRLYNPQMVPHQPPVVKSRFETWRNYTTMAIVISGVSYGFYKLYEKLLRPLIASRQEEKERQVRLEQSIQELSASVKEAVGEMQKSLTSINTLLEQQQVKFNQLTVDNATNVTGTRSAETAEIKTEISSLKGLLLNRHQFPATPQPTPIPAWQRAPVTQEATPTKATPTNKQTSPVSNPPISGTYDEVDQTPGNTLISNSSGSVNHDDAPANSSIDNGDTIQLSAANGQGKSGGDYDNLNQSVNQIGTTSHNENACVDIANEEH